MWLKHLTALALFVSATLFSQANPTDVNPVEKIFQPKLKRLSLKPSNTFRVDTRIPEGSGLIAWNGLLWTHNDSGGEPALFALDTMTGTVVEKYALPNIKNRDWEDICDDSTYIYIGDIGNNAGTNERLHIFRIDKQSLVQRNPVIDTISFTWPVTNTKSKIRKVNFDCEAMIVVKDSIFLFTKEWQNGRRTRMFSVPIKPGNYKAKYRQTIKTRLIVTGATYYGPTNQLALCGHNLWLKPQLLVFEDFSSIYSSNVRARKFNIRKPFRQVEGIATFDGINYYLINEKLKIGPFISNAQLHKVNLGTNNPQNSYKNKNPRYRC